MTLRGYWRSSCSWRVRIALNLKGHSYETVPVHLDRDGGQQHADDHRALNPMRELPVLLVDDRPHRAERRDPRVSRRHSPDPCPAYPDALDRSRVRQMAEVINSGIQPIQNLRVMQRLGREFEIEKPGQRAWSKGWIEFGFDALERLLFNSMVGAMRSEMK